MKQAFIIVAVILFILDAFVYWSPQGEMYRGRLLPAGLAFFAASFMSFVPG